MHLQAYYTSRRRHPGSPSRDFLRCNEEKSASVCAGLMPGGSGSDHAQAWLGAGCDSSERNASQRPVPSRRNKARAYNMGPAQGVLARGLDARQHLMPSSTKRAPIPNAHCPLDACREHPEMAACTARSPHLARTAAKMKIQNDFKLGTNSLSASFQKPPRPF